MSETKSIACTYPNEHALYAAYMPFVSEGGLFIPTQDAFELGDLVNVELVLPNKTVPINSHCRVVWITPKGAHGGKSPGIGVQFIDEGKTKLHSEIETLLAGMVHSNTPTDTI